MDYINILKSYLKKYILPAKGDQSKESIHTLPKSKIDRNKIQELIIREYTQKLLDNLKENYETLFIEKRMQESKTIRYTSEHNNLVLEMADIVANIDKIKKEEIIIETDTKNLIQSIEEDLDLKIKR
jgi:hypothetical protein